MVDACVCISANTKPGGGGGGHYTQQTMLPTSHEVFVDRNRAAAGCAVCMVFVVGWAARLGLDHVADHRYNWMASNALAAGVDVSARPLGTWMDAWNSTCEGKYGVSLNEPAGATLVDTGAHLGSCDGFARQRELSRAPISAVTSLGFLVVSAASSSSDPVLAVSAAAVAAGSYAWHSTGQKDTVHLDHFGCALFGLAVARSLLASLDRVGEAWLNGGLCLVVACVCGFAAPDDGSLYAVCVVAGALVVVFVASLGGSSAVVLNCGVPAGVGLAFHERTHHLGGVATCTADLGDDAVADAVHATWHCCAIVLGVEAAFAGSNTPSALSASTLLLLVGLAEPKIAHLVLLCSVIVGSGACLVRWYVSTAKVSDKAGKYFSLG